MVAGLTGFGPTIMVASSSFNWSSVISPIFSVYIVYATGEGDLVIDLDFIRNQTLNNNPCWT